MLLYTYKQLCLYNGENMKFNVKKITQTASYADLIGEYYIVTVTSASNSTACAQFTRAQIKSLNQIDALHVPVNSIQDSNCGSTLARGMKAIIKHYVKSWTGERYSFKNNRSNIQLATRDIYCHWDSEKVNSLLVTP